MVLNDRELTAWAARTLGGVVGADRVSLADPWMAGEDFSYFANEVPGFFYFLGTQKPGTTSGGHHSPTFRADDAALPVGVRAMAHLIWRYLEDR